MKKLTDEEWDQVSHWIMNLKVAEIPKKLRKVRDSESKMTINYQTVVVV